MCAENNELMIPVVKNRVRLASTTIMSQIP